MFSSERTRNARGIRNVGQSCVEQLAVRFGNGYYSHPFSLCLSRIAHRYFKGYQQCEQTVIVRHYFFFVLWIEIYILEVCCLCYGYSIRHDSQAIPCCSVLCAQLCMNMMEKCVESASTAISTFRMPDSTLTPHHNFQGERK